MGKATKEWVTAVIFPFIYINGYLVYGFFSGLFASFMMSSQTMAMASYLLYIIGLAVFSMYMFKTRKIPLRLGSIRKISIVAGVWLLAQWLYFNYGVPFAEKGWNGPMNFRIDDHGWWMISRFTPLYPFEPIGLAIWRSGFELPSGYIPLPHLGMGDPQNPDLVSVIPIGALPHMILFSLIHAYGYVMIKQNNSMKSIS